MRIAYPVKVSAAWQHASKEYAGVIKVRLAHAHGRSVIIPDQLFLNLSGWHYFEPSFFDACAIAFNVEDALHEARLGVDVGAPQSGSLARLHVKFRSNGLLKRLDDGAQVYACRVEGPRNLQAHAGGRCLRQGDDFALKLFHHTSAVAASSILASHTLRGSSWNLQGTRQLKNVAYAYLTSLPRIETVDDLHRIAMASDGEIVFETESDRHTEERLSLKVYRENTANRRSTVTIHVPCWMLAPRHILFHPLTTTNGCAYYECIAPEIFRVGIKPGAVVDIKDALASTRRPLFPSITA